jgi:adenosylmethionine-8-amino-7-oxononanoate aminotransferase
MIWACDAVIDDPQRAAGFSRRFFTAALEHALLLRPIGRTLYLMPPYILDASEIAHLGAAIPKIFDQVMRA